MLCYAFVCSYLTAQQVVAPGMGCAAITSLLCPLYNWLLIYRLSYGLEGAAWAYMLSISTNAFLLLGYTAWRDMRMQQQGSPACTWPGLTLSAFKVQASKLSALVAYAYAPCHYAMQRVEVVFHACLHRRAGTRT